MDYVSAVIFFGILVIVLSAAHGNREIRRARDRANLELVRLSREVADAVSNNARLEEENRRLEEADRQEQVVMMDPPPPPTREEMDVRAAPTLMIVLDRINYSAPVLAAHIRHLQDNRDHCILLRWGSATLVADAFRSVHHMLADEQLQEVAWAFKDPTEPEEEEPRSRERALDL